MIQSRSARRAVLMSALAVVLTACSGDSTAQQKQQPVPSPAAAVPTAPTPASDSAPLVRGLPDFSTLVERASPAVVNVEVVQTAQNTGGGPGGLSPDDPLSDFFRRFNIPQPDLRGAPQQPLRGAGSGFIVTTDGYILTNAHVVSDADRVTVRLKDRREFQAKVIGADQRTDVAVIKIEAKDLPYVRIGDPSRLKPGEWVLAIGSPFGFDNSATAGIVSATARSLPQEQSNYVPFIQTDVAVNPGNSGGPLFNMQGEVIGINSQIFSRTGGYMGLSFAIPIDVAMDVREQLVKTGRVTRGRIGVTIQNVDAELAESFGLDRPQGALVSSVLPDGPGAKAGLKPGDVILAVNDRPIETSTELPVIIARVKPGTPTNLTVFRGGKEQKISVNVDQLDNEPQIKTANNAQGKKGDEASRLGLYVRPLEPQERQQVETTGTLLVEQVSGPAALAGVQPGDIILGVNGKVVKTLDDLTAAARGSTKTVALLIQRQDAQIFVPLRLS
jgi:serine protease Do